MAPNARFSVQSALAQMRTEQREDHAALVLKVDEGFSTVTETMSAHVLEDTTKFGAIDKRLSTVENTRRSVRWLGGIVIVALLGAFVDFLFVHLPSYLAHP